ncbi:MAG: M67 family metallopeptidase [Solirubrobacterales bacterium]
MLIGRELRDEIVAHARAEAPNECCGIVGAVDGRATTVYRARNEFEDPRRYNVHPQDLFRIISEIEEHGEELAAIYHSHTKSEAYPSQTDVNLAVNWPDPLYAICSLAGPEPVLRAFWIRDAAVEEVELDVDD